MTSGLAFIYNGVARRHEDTGSPNPSVDNTPAGALGMTLNM